MTSPPDRPPLEDALGIPGARAVSLLDPDGPTVLWWAGTAPPDEQQVTAVVTLAAAAAGLVMLTDPGDEFGDVLLTSSDTFHVMRLVEHETPRVAHLTLRRTGANLAMARREFRSLIETHTQRAAPGAKHSAASPLAVPPVLPFPASPLPASPLPAPPPAEPLALDGPDALPRRPRLDPAPAEPVAASTDDAPDLRTLLVQPYTTDDEALDRILGALRRL